MTKSVLRTGSFQGGAVASAASIALLFAPGFYEQIATNAPDVCKQVCWTQDEITQLLELLAASGGIATMALRARGDDRVFSPHGMPGLDKEQVEEITSELKRFRGRP